MYQFILNQWILGRADESFVRFQYEKNRITEKERDMILATAKDV